MSAEHGQSLTKFAWIPSLLRGIFSPPALLSFAIGFVDVKAARPPEQSQTVSNFGVETAYLEDKTSETSSGHITNEESLTGRWGCQILWESDVGYGDANETGEAKPFQIGNQILVADRAGNLTATDMNSGKRLWRRNRFAGAPSSEEDSADLSTGPTPLGEYLALTSARGDLFLLTNQKEARPLWSVKINQPLYNRPVLKGDTVFIQDSFQNLYALEAQTGETKWVHPLLDTSPDPGFFRGYTTCGVPLVYKDGLILALDSQGYLSLVDQETGDKVARELLFSEGGQSGSLTAEAVLGFAKPQQDRDLIYIATPKGICALDRHFIGRKEGINTQKVWGAHDQVWSDFLLHKQRLYYTTMRGDLVAVHRRSGSEVWRTRLAVRSTQLLGTPILSEVDGQALLLVSDRSGTVHGVDPTSGERVMRVPLSPKEGLYGSLLPLEDQGSWLALSLSGSLICFKPKALTPYLIPDPLERLYKVALTELEAKQENPKDLVIRGGRDSTDEEEAEDEEDESSQDEAGEEPVLHSERSDLCEVGPSYPTQN